MPTYEYRCKSCGEHMEVVQSFKDEPLTVCPGCGGLLRKVFGNIGIAFKGSGFYKTDSRAASKGASKMPESAGSSSSSESSGSGSSGSPGSSGSESSGSSGSSGSGSSSPSKSSSGSGSSSSSKSSSGSGSSGGSVAAS